MHLLYDQSREILAVALLTRAFEKLTEEYVVEKRLEKHEASVFVESSRGGGKLLA